MRDMGRIPLLTRNEELVLAKEMERGEAIVIKALSKTRFVQNEILSLEEKLAQLREFASEHGYILAEKHLQDVLDGLQARKERYGD